MMPRKMTKVIQVGGIKVGGNNPISVQSMLTTDTRDSKKSLQQIRSLDDAGCEIVRLAVPDAAAGEALADICRRTPLPIVADIHFDYRLALKAIAAGVDAIRINPGNIKDKDGIRQIVEKCRARHIPIRIGINSGSIPEDVAIKYGGVNAESLAYAALQTCKELEQYDFYDICLSAKASDPVIMIGAYRYLSEECEYPLHLGVTEAGTFYRGIISSAVGIGTLLAEGIGDTIRVSLTADPTEEVKAAYAILAALSLRKRGARLVSCPTCGRTEVDLLPMAEKLSALLEKIEEPLDVALMGCVVNGPGEAKACDIGLAGGKNSFVLFRHGKVIGKVAEKDALDVLMKEIAQIIEERKTHV